MKVSIVTITRKDGERLAYSLESVRRQTHPDVEHIIVDGNPGDEALPLLARYPGVRVIRRKPAGVYDAMNCGLAAATGQVLGFVHGSDQLGGDDVLARVAATFESDPDLDFVFGDLMFIRPRSRRPVRLYSADKYDPARILDGIVPPHPTLFVRRRVLDKVGYYVTDMSITGDYDMWIRLFSDRSLHYRYIPATLSMMTLGGLSTKFTSRLFVNNIQKLKVLRRHNLPANPLRLARKYVYVLKGLLKCHRK